MGALFCIYLSVYYMDSYTAMVPSFQQYIVNHFWLMVSWRLWLRVWFILFWDRTGIVKLFGILLNIVNYYWYGTAGFSVIDIECKPFGFDVLCKKSSKKRFCFARADTVQNKRNLKVFCLILTSNNYEVTFDILSYKTRQSNLSHIPSPAKHLLTSTPLACNPFQCWLGPGSSCGKVTAILIDKFQLKGLCPGEGK